MAVTGIEWVIIAAVVLILFIWGPEKLPKMARAFGQAKREFEKASKGIETEIGKTRTGIESEVQRVISPGTGEGAQPAATSDDQLLEAARTLGISTEGKTRGQIASEILERIKQQEKA